MTCDRIRPLLSSYHDDTLSLEERARVRMHVATCPDCSAVLAAYERMFAALCELTTPVPADLRRNVYARIAAIEAQRSSSLPFGPALLGMLRSAGGTAGLLAVLAALVAAIVHLNTPQTASPTLSAAASRAMLTAAAGTVVDAMVGAQSVARLPAAVQTAVAPSRSGAKREAITSAALKVNHTKISGSHMTLDGEIVPRLKSGAPRALIPAHIAMALASGTPVVNSMVMGTPSPEPTIPAGDGLIYLQTQLDNPRQFYAGYGNARYAQVEFHTFAPGGQPRVLVTPVATVQMLTGVNASLDGNTAMFTAMSPQMDLGGAFSFSAQSPYPTHVVALRDLNLPNHGFAHRYVQQAYGTVDGRWLFSVVDSFTASVAMTSGHGLQTVVPISQPTYDFVVSPNRQYLIQTRHPSQRFGTLQIATLALKPVTRTVVLGYHPVWSPQGDSILFLGKARRGAPAGLFIWSLRDGSVRQVVQDGSGGQPFVSSFAWAPGGRYFAYVLTTTDKQHGASTVWLADTQTELTWRSFQRRWISAIAWVHSQALPVATPAPPAVFDATTSPAGVLSSFYNAINRRDFQRAYAYLSSHKGGSFTRWQKGYDDTADDSNIVLQPARYRGRVNGRVRTCVGFQMIAHHWNGQNTKYGGWYMVEQTPGRDDWRIVMAGTKIAPNGTATIPSQARCLAPTHSAAAA